MTARRFSAIGFVLIFLVLTEGARSAQYAVPAQFASIQGAINAARDGDEIVVADGEYYGPLFFYGKEITVRSENGPGNCVIKPYDQGRCVYFIDGETTNTILWGFTLSGDSPCRCDEEIEGEVARGGVYCLASSPTLVECIIRDCETDGSGGGMVCREDANPVLVLCGFGSNRAAESGGALYCDDSSPHLKLCVIASNTCELAGGGIACVNNSRPVIDFTYLYGNRALNGDSSEGGGLSSRDASPIFRRGIIHHNVAALGAGACFRGSGLPTVEDSYLLENVCWNGLGGYGGGAACLGGGNAAIRNCTFFMNRAMDGGGLVSSLSSPTIESCFFLLNEAIWGGGMEFVDEGRAAVRDCGLARNTAYEFGGGVSAEFGAAPVFDRCLIAGNRARGVASPSGDGGLWENGTGGGLCLRYCNARLLNTAVFENDAAVAGGGIYCLARDTNRPSLRNCTVTYNRAGNRGSALYVYRFGGSDTALSVLNSLFWANEHSLKTGFPIVGHSTTRATLLDFQYCDIWEHPYSVWMSGLASASYTACLNNDPWLLDPVHIDPASPCVDRGLTTFGMVKQKDIDLEPRLSGGRVDIGADEVFQGDGGGLFDKLVDQLQAHFEPAPRPAFLPKPFDLKDPKYASPSYRAERIKILRKLVAAEGRVELPPAKP